MRLTSDSYLFTSDGDHQSNPNYQIILTTKNFTVVANLPQEFTFDLQANYEEAFSQTIGNLPAVQTIGPWARALGIQLSNQAMTAQVWQGSSEVTFSLPLELQAETNAETDVLEILGNLYSLVLPDELGGPGGLLTAPGPVIDPTALVSSVVTTAGNLGAELKKKIGNKLDSLKSSSLSSLTGSLADQIRNSSPIGSLTLPDAKTASSSDSKGGASTNSGRSNPLVSSIENNISLMLGRQMYFESVVVTSVNQTSNVTPVESGTFSRVQVTVGFKTFFTPTKKDIKSMLPNLPSAPPGTSGLRPDQNQTAAETNRLLRSGGGGSF